MKSNKLSPFRLFNKDNQTGKPSKNNLHTTSASAPKKPNMRPAQSIMAFTDDDQVITALTHLAEDGTIVPAEIIPGGLASALVFDHFDCDLILADMGQSEVALDAIGAIGMATDARLVILGEENDVSLYRTILESGANDYLLKPLELEILAASCMIPVQLPQFQTGHASEQTCGLHLVIGARGGVGATSIAVSTAWDIAQHFDKQTALIDLDVHFGNCALALDLMPERGLRDALENPDRIDSLFVSSAMVSATDKLFLLAGEDSMDQGLKYGPDALNALLEALTDNFQAIVVDLPRHLALEHPELLDEANSITLISDLSLAGLRDCLRVQNWLFDRGLDIKPRILVSENANGKPAIKRSEFEDGLTAKIDQIIPSLPKQAAFAQSSGRPLSEVCGKRTPYSKEINALAEWMVGPAKQAEKKSWWR